MSEYVDGSGTTTAGVRKLCTKLSFSVQTRFPAMRPTQA
jgi:hypothetical protein